MATKLQKDRKIIDIFTMQVHDISSNMIMKCKELDIDYTVISKLEKGKQVCYKSQYTTPNNLYKIFTLIDVDTNIEYNCIDNKSIFIQMNYQYSDNEGKYVYELKSGRQTNASICGKVFTLKGSKTRKITKLKNDSKYINDIRADAYNRKIIKYRISKRIWQSMKDVKSKKDNLTEELLGCNMVFYMKYLKSRFVKEMTFKNYGDWHIDHIIPVSHFNIKNKKERLKAFHYTNTQPIWATTEIAKQYGYDNYIGNLNKNNNGGYEDYLLTSIISSNTGFTKITEMSRLLFQLGIRKVK